jgi:hypothetical protein
MATRPLVAIFWFIADDTGVAHDPTRGCPLDTVEPCGDRLAFPRVHHNIGEAWRRHTLPLPIPTRRLIVAITEYNA